MYELWLAINILYEIGLMYLPNVIGFVVVTGALFGLALAKRAPLCRGVMPAALVWALVTVGGLFLIPGMTASALKEVAYWVDWANLFAVAAGFGAAAAAITLPIAAMVRGGNASDALSASPAMRSGATS